MVEVIAIHAGDCKPRDFCDSPDEQHDPDCRCGKLEAALGTVSR